ncbi:MAG: very short patch repair endonuclease [Clostridiales bacterium]
MADVHDKATRSFNMSRIRSKNTKPELLLRSTLFSNGYRYRLHDKGLPGKPDIVLKKYRTVIFVNGCFWHGHKDCKYYVIPKTRTEWWENKIAVNIQNDFQKRTQLINLGWKYIDVFECELKKDKLERTLTNIYTTLKKNQADA